MPPSFAHRLAAEIRAEMARRRLTQTALASWLNLTPKQVYRILNTPGTIDIARLEQICLCIGVTPEELAARAA